MKARLPVKKIAAGIGIGSLLTAGTAFYIAHRVIHPKRKKQEETPKSFWLNYKNISFKSADGTLLKGWLIETNEPKGLIILSHGYSFDKQSMLPAAKALYKNNYSSLLFDYRAHGESSGDKTTIGVKEKDDLLAAVDFARKFSDKIGIFGISMGAASTVMAAPKIEGLKAIVIDSCFQSLKKIIYRKSPLLTGLIIQFMKSQGVEVEKSAPIDYIDKIKCPVFLIHGDKDDLVPFEDSEKLFEKAKDPKELWIVKGGIHGRSYFIDREEYSKKVIGFFDRWFS